MGVGITKTSFQERERIRKESTCPDCGKSSRGIVETKTTGFFSLKFQKRKSYRCYWCKSEWNTDWQ